MSGDVNGEPLDARTLVGGHFGRQLFVVMRDAHRHTWQRVAAETFLEAAPDAVFVELGVPVWRPDGTGYLATHGAGA